MSRKPTEGIDYTSKDYESYRSDMIKQLGIKMPEYTDIRQSDAGIVILELLAQGLDVLSYYQDAIANEAFLVTAEQRNNALKWCKMLDYIPKSSTPSEFTQVFVLSSRQQTDTVIPEGTRVKTVGTTAESSIYFETTEDLVIPAGALGDEMENGEYLYSVKVIQGITIPNELLGSSTDSPNQKFVFNYTPVIYDSIKVFVNEQSGFEKWTKVDNFVDSSTTSKHYTASLNDNDEAIITFGDGVFGKIPKSYKNGIYCSYRIGGGTQGNVGANKITLLDSNIALVASTFNPYVADVEGQDKESLEEIKTNAPLAYRTVWGAITTQDYSDIVKINFSNVDKISSYCSGTDISMYIILKNNAGITEDFKKKVLALFNENSGGRKVIGTGSVTISPAILTPINIKATLAVKPRYSFDTVKAQIVDYLTNFFAVGNYDFDTELSLSELVANIMSETIDGIRYLKITSPTDDVLIPSQGAVFTLGSLDITNGGA